MLAFSQQPPYPRTHPSVGLGLRGQIPHGPDWHMATHKAGGVTCVECHRESEDLVIVLTLWRLDLLGARNLLDWL